MKIKINGHVNWPKKNTTPEGAEFNMKLSTDRAKAVYDYLAKHGVKEERLSYEGFGNTQMIYPNPATKEEILSAIEALPDADSLSASELMSSLGTENIDPAALDLLFSDLESKNRKY